MPLRLALAVLALAAATPVAAKTELPMLTLDAPAGWAASPVENGVVFKRELKGQGGLLIAVESRPLSGAFDAAFEAAADALDALKDEEPLTQGAGESTLGHKMRYEVRCCAGGDVSAAQTLVAFNPPGRIVTAALVEIGRLDDDAEDAAEAAFEALVAGLDFEGFGTRPPVPRTLGYGTKLDGFYTHTEGQLRINPFGGTDFVSVDTTYAFDPSGRFAPAPPLAGTTTQESCAKEPAGCGVYTVIGKRIALKTVDGRFGRISVETLPFAAGEGSLTLGERTFMAVQPERNLTLDGTWTYFWAQSGSTAFGSNSVSATRTLTFTPDGRYTRTGSSSFASANEVGDTTVRAAGGGPKTPVAGRYSIDGFTLTLDPAAGAAERLRFYRPRKDDIDLLMVDGDPYLREGRR